MFWNLIKKTWIWVIFLGGILIATSSIGIITNSSIITLHTRNIGGWQWNYATIDIQAYLTNLQNAIKPDTLPIEKILPLKPELPTWPSLNWSIANWWLNIAEILRTIAKYMIYGINWIIYIINVLTLTMPKIIVYPLRAIITLLGIQTTDKGFVGVVNFIYSLQIPYITINF